MEQPKDMLWFVITLLGGAVATLGYLLRDLYQSNKQRHKEHDERYDDLDKRILSDDEILHVVNGEYQKRREADDRYTAIKERIATLESSLIQRHSVAEDEIKRLRDHFHMVVNRIQKMDSR